MNASQNLPILFIEDDENDVIFLRRALQSAGITQPVHFVTNGQAAIDYLSARGPYSDRAAFPLPGLIITDFKLPLKTGAEVIEWVRQQPQLRRIPIIVLSSTANPGDIALVYETGGNSFLVKPSGTRELGKMMLALKNYWLDLNQVA